MEPHSASALTTSRSEEVCAPDLRAEVSGCGLPFPSVVSIEPVQHGEPGSFPKLVAVHSILHIPRCACEIPYAPPVIFKRVVLLLKLQRTTKEKVRSIPILIEFLTLSFSCSRCKVGQLELQCLAEDDGVTNVLSVGTFTRCRLWASFRPSHPSPVVV